ncbi:unnamed protein product [Urochloa humidicola]
MRRLRAAKAASSSDHEQVLDVVGCMNILMQAFGHLSHHSGFTFYIFLISNCSEKLGEHEELNHDGLLVLNVCKEKSLTAVFDGSGTVYLCERDKGPFTLMFFWTKLNF